MKKLLVSLVFCMAVPCCAEVEFVWKQTSIPEETKKIAEETVKDAAKTFMDKKYADVGEIDFLCAITKYTVCFDEVMTIGCWDPWKKRISLDYLLVANRDILYATAIHEFSHAYTAEKVEEIKQSGDLTKYYRFLGDTEHRAEQRERWAIDALHVKYAKVSPASWQRIEKYYIDVQELENYFLSLQKTYLPQKIRDEEIDKRIKQLLKSIESQEGKMR